MHYEAELEINDFAQHARWKVRSMMHVLCLILVVPHREGIVRKNAAISYIFMHYCDNPCYHIQMMFKILLFFQQITHRDTLSLVTELTGAAITTRGQYNRPGTVVPPGERKLYLLIEGSSESSIKKAKAELKKILAETQEKVMRRDPPSGKYSVM